jgi:tetratricopeptide (TPR) repeat protein
MVLVGERIRAGDLERAIELVDSFLAGDEKNIALNLAKLQLLQNLGNETAVETHLLRLAEILPDLPQFRTLLAQYYDRQGDTVAAKAQMRAIAEADPSNAAAALDVARFLIRTEGIEAGRAELERLIATAERKFPFQMALAQLDQNNGREAEARALLEEIIARGSNADDVNAARVQLARFQLDADDRVGARGLVETVITEDAKNVDALAIRAALLIDEEDYDAAILDLHSALGEDPRNVTLLLLAATAQERNGNPELAGERLATAMHSSEYAPEVVLRYVRFLRGRARMDAAETVLVEAVQNRPGERELLGALGMARLQLRDWGGAEQAAASLRALGNPEAGRAADRIRAAALSGQEKFVEALDLLHQIAENPDRAGSTMGAIVQTYVNAGQIERAVTFVENQLVKTPEDPLALRLRGALHQIAGEADEAEARYRAVIAARSDSPGEYEVLARFYLAENRGAEAEQVLRDGLAAVPNNPGLLLGLASLLEARGDFDAAIEFYGRLYEVRPDSVVAANNFASIVADHRADDPESLERAFRAAKRLRSSEVPQYQDTYGWLQYLRGDFNGALRSLIPVAEALPDNPWVRYHIGMTYAKLGKDAEARPHLESALDLAGNGPFPKANEIRAALMKLAAE